MPFAALLQAISTGASSPYNEVADLRGQSIGISRFTSGSHLMTCVLASQRGWAQSDIKYVVQGSFEQLRAGVNSGETAAFMWEHFTTKPFYDSGEIRRIGQIVTPWPCFLLCSSDAVLADESKRGALKLMQGALQESCRLFHAGAGRTVEEVSRRFGLRLEDAQAWFDGVHISASGCVCEGTLEQALEALKDAGVLTGTSYPSDKPLQHFVHPAFAQLKQDIKTMRIYHRPELLTALYNNIRVRLAKERGKLSYKELLQYDQNHYGGIQALRECIAACGLGSSSRVLQLGSSVGGPSRFLAGEVGCEVLAVELQEDLHACARELTGRCGLQDRVSHLSGSILQVGGHLASASYDCVASWLTILHFDEAERAALFAEAYRLLKPGGFLYAEDFFELAPFTPSERHSLSHDVFCRYLPSLPEYSRQICAAGFELVEARDLTPEWTSMTQERASAFQENKEKEVAVHGEQLVNGLQFFYSAVAQLFKGGHCGGVRIVARKPLESKL